ncbi:MAG: response regulator transcription factor [Bacteroidetes bacterium]|nr:response regulator transcription factor [Bacteroidota bacterium]
MNCIAVDDEPLALDLMTTYIRQVPGLHLVKTCSNAVEAMEVMHQEHIDLIFLDIQMPGLTGLQFVQSLKQKPFVVFTTAYTKYALDGYELDVLDYLVKPFSFERFLKCVNKATEAHKLLTSSTPSSLKALPPDYLFVNADYSLVKINISDIAYVEGLKDYIKIFTSGNNKAVVTRMSMKAIEERLLLMGFRRIHKSHIVNLSKISSIKKSRVVIDGVELTVGDSYRSGLFKSLGLDIPESE